MERQKSRIITDSTYNPTTLHLTTVERIQFLANLIVDRIIEDQHNGSPLLKKVLPK